MTEWFNSTLSNAKAICIVSYPICEYLDDFVVTDDPNPRLGWKFDSSRRGARQSAYRIEVATSPELLVNEQSDLWDTGRVESGQTNQIVYRGKPLSSRMRCYWHVTTWDEAGDKCWNYRDRCKKENTAFEPPFWIMGLLNSDDWSASWISHDPEIIRRDPEAIEGTPAEPGSVPLFRKSFNLPSPPKSAMLYVSACGLIEPSVNSHSITWDKFIPEWTDYNKRMHYRCFDVTKQLQPGANTLCTMLGDGWWSGFVGWQETRGQYGSLRNSFLMQMEVECENGERITVVSDDSWHCETGPILYSDFMMGELYDARRERDGWESPEYDDSEWPCSVEVEPPRVHIPKYGFSNNTEQDTGEPLPLVMQPCQPIQDYEILNCKSVHEVAPHRFVYDFGQNFAGWAEIDFNKLLPEGTRIEIRYAERLNPDGTLYTENLRRATATDIYIARGGEYVEFYKPFFTFHGFQYLEISGLTEPLHPDDITAHVLKNDMLETGSFACSHPLVNRLWQNALWGQKGNFLSVPTDCPQRDERLGWMGDAQVFCRTAMYNMDCAAFFTKWMIDIEDSQDVDGIFPDVAPRLREGDNFCGLDGLGGGAGWADAGVIIPWTMWRMYDDTRVIERHWGAMVKWMDWLDRVNPNSIRENHLNNNYGDWLCIPSDREFRTHSPMKTLLATAFWAHDADYMAQMARAIGRTAEAEQYEAVFARVRDAFQREWLLEDGRLAVDTQTAYLLALDFGLLPEAVRARAAEHLVENIRNLDWHLSTGFIGIRHLNPILTEFGHADVAYRLLLNEDYPSWLYPVKHGATTIWERWNGWTAEDGFFNPQMNSFNHYSLGSVAEWLYRHVAGIELDPEVNGFKRFVIKPYVGGGLTWAEGEYGSIHGTIQSRWDLQGDTVRMTIMVPPNTAARVYVPCDEGSEVTERGVPAAQSECVTEIGREGDRMVYEVAAGRYHFVAKLSNPIGIAGRD